MGQGNTRIRDLGNFVCTETGTSRLKRLSWRLPRKHKQRDCCSARGVAALWKWALLNMSLMLHNDLLLARATFITDTVAWTSESMKAPPLQSYGSLEVHGNAPVRVEDTDELCLCVCACVCVLWKEDVTSGLLLSLSSCSEHTPIMINAVTIVHYRPIETHRDSCQQHANGPLIWTPDHWPQPTRGRARGQMERVSERMEPRHYRAATLEVVGPRVDSTLVSCQWSPLWGTHGGPLHHKVKTIH